jgi:hypothetical protein
MTRLTLKHSTFTALAVKGCVASTVEVLLLIV